MAKKFEIRNSTAEFLTFVAEGKEQGIQVLYKDETVWATQKAMALLFDCSADNIGLHLKNIYDSKELTKEATTEKISVVQQEGAREVRRNTLFYNLDAIISVGYRVNSIRATQFRQWCTYVIRQFSLRGYIIDKKRMANRHIPMTMEDLAKRIDIILEAGGDAVLHDAGKVSAEFAKSFAEAEFEKYRVIQDRFFSSDFDRFNSSLPFDDDKN